MKQSQEWFLERSREMVNLRGVLALLSWDQETLMPPRGSPLRAQQSAMLAGLYHEMLTQPQWADVLEELEDVSSDPWISASVREMRRQHQRAVRIPESLVRELAETTSLGYQVWVDARERSDFGMFAGPLEKIIRLKREEARCLQFPGSPYNALLDEYEPEMTTTELDALFSVLRPKLTDLVARIGDSAVEPNSSILQGDFPRPEQEAFGRRILTAMGFDWEAGRLDVSAHPFCSGFSPMDVRITTRYAEDSFASSLFGIVHEGGHALYEQGLGEDHFGLPAGDSISLGIHESQSRLWENQVARSRPFWDYWFPHLKETFPGRFDVVPLDDFMPAINLVGASLIRVEADEVTYGLHVILRYELEKSLLEGSLAAQDLDKVWKERMREYLGVVPQTSSEGVLQDTHWSQGLIGYFPTYLLGNLYAAQMFQQAQRDLPDLEQLIRSGELKPLREWLRVKVHAHGKTLSASELIHHVSGEPLDSSYFLNYLESKFGDLYALR